MPVIALPSQIVQGYLQLQNTSWTSVLWAHSIGTRTR
jgi:hypothetical protein